MIPKKMLIGIT
jgi:HrpA-like RNA helicase